MIRTIALFYILRTSHVPHFPPHTAHLVDAGIRFLGFSVRRRRTPMLVLHLFFRSRAAHAL
jgi:hypothetical protein